MTNEQVALWVGWTDVRTARLHPGSMGNFEGIRSRVPDYTQEGPHWQAVYREIERRGLCMAYSWHLQQAVSDRADVHWQGSEWAKLAEWSAYALATATAAERLEALGKVMEEERHA